MGKSKFSLQILEAYAKKITFALATRLFEAKTKKKYNKALFEAKHVKMPPKYTYYLDNSVLYEYIEPVTGLQNKNESADTLVSNMLNMSYSVRPDGIIFATDSKKSYGILIERLKSYDVPEEIIEDNADPIYLNNN